MTKETKNERIKKMKEKEMEKTKQEIEEKRRNRKIIKEKDDKRK